MLADNQSVLYTEIRMVINVCEPVRFCVSVLQAEGTALVLIASMCDSG